jgi:glycosyltransferase involved in cell wall biosynthesis
VTIVAHRVVSSGGMERAVLELISGLLAAGYTVSVISRVCELPSNPRLRWIRVSGPERPFVPAFLWFALVGSFKVWRHSEGLVHTIGAIVPGHADVATVQFCHHAFQADRPVQREKRSGPIYRASAAVSARLSRLAETWSYRPSRVRRLIAVSNGVAGELGHHFPPLAGGIAVIPNGVDSQAFRPDPDARLETRNLLGLDMDGLTALFVGGDWERKGLRIAIEAIALTASWKLLVLGDGDQARYREYARSAGADGRVIFARPTKDPQPFYATADAFVFPSSYEGFPLVVLEAAASGLPLVVPPVNGTSELIGGTEAGWLVAPEPRAIADRLDELRDSDLRQRMGAAAREAASRYSWDRIVLHHIDVYEALLAEAARTRPANK